ncbi:MAG: tetratricopeptide repeat protein, partial [Candidatus Saccharibacteria bacterium]
MPSETSVSGSKAVNVSAFGKFMNLCLQLLVFLTPLLFLPFTSEVREFNKQALLFVLAVVMLGVWVVKILTTRKVSWVKTSLDYILLGFGVIYLISSFLSIDKISSFLGYYGRFTGSFVSILSLIILYYLVVNNVRGEKIAKRLMGTLMVSGFLAMLYSFLQLINVNLLAGKPFHWAFASGQSFNSIGSLASIAIFSSIMVVLAQWAWLNYRSASMWRKLGYGLVTLLGLAILFLINAFIAWIVLAAGMIVLLALELIINVNSQTSATWFWRPMIVLVIGILFIAFQFLPGSLNPRQIVRLNVPQEIQLNNSTTWNLVANSIKSKPLLGYGPGTTGIAYGEIKPQVLNKTIVWSLNFDRASSEIGNIAIETGILGLVAFEGISLIFLFYALMFLIRGANHPGRQYAFGLFAVWATLYVTHFFYFFNTTFYFLFWFSLAMFMAVAHWQETQDESDVSVSASPRSALSWMFASLLILAVLLVGVFFEAAVYSADVSYASGLKELSKNDPDFSVANGDFARAISLNSYRDVYYLAYAQNLVFLASQEAAKKDPNVQQFQSWITQLVAAANTAVKYSPNKSSNWSARAQFYNQIRPLAVAGTDKAIVDSWLEAVKRDEKNPILLVQLAQAYVNGSQTIDPKIAGTGADSDNDGLADDMERELGSNPNSTDSNGNEVPDGDEVKAGFNPATPGRLTAAQLSKFVKVDESMLKKAEEALKQAIVLKDDLPDSYIALARLYETWNKMDEAGNEMSIAVNKFPGNMDVLYEQGRIAFNQKKYSDAEKTFSDLIKYVPNHANGHYSMGLIYLQKNDKANALKEFEKTREITGPNVDLEKVINDLRAQIATPPA